MFGIKLYPKIFEIIESIIQEPEFSRKASSQPVFSVLF
jgi:hypothetical protein